MKAFLVTISVTTRVVVDAEDDTAEDIILEAAQPRLRDAVSEGIEHFVESIEEDEESPYNPETDTETGTNE